MNTVNTTNVKVLSRVATVSPKDGKTYYKLLVMQKESAGDIKCNDIVYNSVKEGTEVSLVTNYNEQYGSFRAVGVVTDSSTK